MKVKQITSGNDGYGFKVLGLGDDGQMYCWCAEYPKWQLYSRTPEVRTVPTTDPIKEFSDNFRARHDRNPKGIELSAMM